MRPPVNRWRLAGVVLNCVGTMILLWYSRQPVSVTPTGHLEITVGTWATSRWWLFGSLGLNLLGFGCQLISNFRGGERRTPHPAGAQSRGTMMLDAGMPWPAIAASAYRAYAANTGHTNDQGHPMPAWEDLPRPIQIAWEAAARQVAVCLEAPDDATSAEARWAGWVPPEARCTP
jgi:hypothetical protein